LALQSSFERYVPLRALYIAIFARTIQKKLVRGGAKTAWQSRGNLRTATIQLIQLVTVVTVKVMVMPFARDFISRRLARDLDRLQPTVFQQRIDISIDGRHP
jgi:hypothetical protein